MKVNALDHVNIITDDLQGTARFFVDVFGLDVRDAPAPLLPELAQWLYDDSGRAIFHINATEMQQAFNRPTRRVRKPARSTMSRWPAAGMTGLSNGWNSTASTIG